MRKNIKKEFLIKLLTSFFININKVYIINKTLRNEIASIILAKIILKLNLKIIKYKIYINTVIILVLACHIFIVCFHPPFSIKFMKLSHNSSQQNP